MFKTLQVNTYCNINEIGKHTILNLVDAQIRELSLKFTVFFCLLLTLMRQFPTLPSMSQSKSCATEFESTTQTALQIRGKRSYKVTYLYSWRERKVSEGNSEGGRKKENIYVHCLTVSFKVAI